ncbi:MAG: lipopolysaccharide biosynthesis protein [Gemmobacter sp.]
MTDARFYLSLFFRRSHYFLLISMVVAAVAVTVAMTLPPAYVAQTRLLIEAPQIPAELATSTVNQPVQEQLQIIEQRLMTRANLLDIARRTEVFDDLARMNADEIVRAMRARTDIRSAGARDAAPLMSISFEATSGTRAARVLNEYLTLIQRDNVTFRTARAGQTLEFFEREVARLGEELDRQSARILALKTENSDALPDALQFRLTQQASLQERLSQISRDISMLTAQRERTVEMFHATGRTTTAPARALTPQERELERMQGELDDLLLVLSEENPRVRMARARIEQLEAAVRRQAGVPVGDDNGGLSMLDVQLAELDTRIALLREQQAETEVRLDALGDAIARTPANMIALDELNRTYENLQQQYNTAVDRLARASTGDRIEALSQGQRISVIEPPATPDEPTKPNRVLIAGGGSVLGVMLGLGFIVLLEVLNRTARRPEDIVNRLGVQPLAVIPHMRTRREVLGKRFVRSFVLTAILLGVPLAVYAVHQFYLPLDLLADRAMDRIGVRW